MQRVASMLSEYKNGFVMSPNVMPSRVVSMVESVLALVEAVVQAIPP
jgi:hypothetical protein